MVDLSTEYLGLKLRNPLVAAASPLTANPISILQLEEAGIAAVVMPSLFEEQVVREDHISGWHDTTITTAPSLQDGQSAYRTDLSGYNQGPDSCLRRVEAAKKDVRIPVIPSLNCASLSSWVRFARLFELAGADALELNIYSVPNDARTTTRTLEEGYVEIVSAVTDTIEIPVAVKLVPFFSALPYFANRLVNAGASGLILFNRFIEPSLDLENFEVVPRLDLSERFEQRLPLRWIAILRDQIRASMAANTGFHETTDILQALAVGADVVQMASALICNGASHVAEILTQLSDWMSRHQFESLERLRGIMSQQRCPDPSVYDRAYYMNCIAEYSKSHC